MNIQRAFFLFFILLFFRSDAQFYQGSQMNFGKNRVQYNNFYWTYYRFKNFDTYFYVGGKELAAWVGKNAPKEIDDIESIFDYRSTDRFQFIIFNKLSDMKQTNVGLESDDQPYNIGGVTRIVGNKILLYFDGNHEHLRQHIRAGIAKVLFDQLMYGGSIKERLQASILLNIPNWYSQGLTSYLARGWTAEDDNRMRDGILSGRYKKFNTLLENEEIFAGHSVWKYISDNYGRQSLSNLIYMTRINRSIESGFVYVLGMNLNELSANWLNYFQKIYLDTEKDKFPFAGEEVIKKTKQNRVYSQVKLSPEGGRIAYVSNDIGKYRIKIVDLKTGKSKQIDKGGYKSLQQENDKSSPLVAWHPSGKFLAILKEKKGKMWLNIYDIESRKTEVTLFLYFEKVLDMSYSDNGQQIVFSGVQKGQSDIFIFNTRGRNYSQLTNDIYDDLYPRFTDGSTKIIFSSNRSNDTLGTDDRKNMPQNNLDIFLIDAAGSLRTVKRITYTPDADELQPMQIDSASYAFLSDENGIYNRSIAIPDSTISYIDTTEHYRYFSNVYNQTNYKRNIEQHDLSWRKNKYAELHFEKGRYRIRVSGSPVASKVSLETKKEIFKDKAQQKVPPKKSVDIVGDKTEIIITEVPEEKPVDSAKVDVNNYVFQSEFSSKKKKQLQQPPITDSTELLKQQEEKQKAEIVVSGIAAKKAADGIAKAKKDSSGFMLPIQRNYDLAFSTDYFVSQLDNSLFNATYQAYTGGAVYFDPGINALFKVGMSDLMNDYKITGGFRFAGDFNSNEYLLSFEMLKQRIDRQMVFYRQARIVSDGFTIQRIHTHDIKLIHKLPLNDLTAIKGTVDFRADRLVTVSTDINALKNPTYYNYWTSAKLEYIYDNTISKGLNLYNGLRYKLFAEVFQKTNKPTTQVFVTGADFRYYLKVHRQIIWANRFAASVSFGKQKLLYYLGSEDNAIVPASNFNYNISVDHTQNYAFQTLASPLRGFVQNIRNGNHFALINSELRIPLFQYIVRRPIRSDFVRNFQVVGFTDIGTAWTGDSPYGKDNSLNVQTISQGPITVTIIKQIEPVVGGYGFGLRSRLFGYFVRTDWAWGIDDKEIQKPVFYLSLGLDF